MVIWQTIYRSWRLGFVKWVILVLLVGVRLFNGNAAMLLDTNHSLLKLANVIINKSDPEATDSITRRELANLEKSAGNYDLQNPRYLWLLANWYQVANQSQPAIDIYKTLLTRFHYRERLVMQRLGRNYYRMGQVAQAADYWAQAGLCRELNRTAAEEINRKSWQTAYQLAQAGLAACPYNTDGIDRAITALRGSGDLTGALTLIDDALKNGPPSLVGLWLTKGQIQGDLGDWEGSLQSCQMVLEIPSIYADGLSCIARAYLYGRQEPETAITYLIKSIALVPQDVWNYIVLGDAYTRLKQYTQAEQAYRWGTEAVPESDISYTWLAYLYRDQHNYPAAEKVLNDALQRQPDSVRALTEYGALLLEENRTDEALAKLQLAVQGEPSNIKAIDLLAQAYRQAGNVSSAIELYQKILSLDPTNEAASKALDELQKLVEGK